MKEDKFGDLGFGNKITDAQTRLINRDGNFNVRRAGLSFFQSFNLYHTLISISWPKFIGFILLVYILINSFFALLYLLAGVQNLDGIVAKNSFDQFWEAFFFSTQTFTTVGYGHVSPVGFGVNVIAALESLTGLLTFAIATGLLYGRFSRPKARILFSDYAIIAPYQDKTAFEFRIANARSNQLIEIEVQVVLTRIEKLSNGQETRKFYELQLERKRINFLALSWTIVHPIDESSPLNGWTVQDLERADSEFLVLIKAFDDTFSQTVQTRSSYHYHEIIWGAKFKNMYDNKEKGVTTLNLNNLSSLEKVEL